MTKKLFSLVALLLVGCDEPGRGPSTTIDAGTSFYSGEVKEIRLSDGTVCAVLLGYQRGGIDCNWPSERIEQ